MYGKDRVKVKLCGISMFSFRTHKMHALNSTFDNSAGIDTSIDRFVSVVSFFIAMVVTVLRFLFYG